MIPMTDLPSPMFEWLHQHSNLAGIVTFLISTMESVAIIGTIIPGSVMMTGIGALAGAGIIPLWQTILWAILGAILGDGISYWAGRYFNTRLPQLWPFRGYPGLLENGERFFHRHGGMSVFIGRFVGPVRALVPLVAGMLGMPPLRFTFANILSAIGWAPAYMLPGILIGAASLELPPDIAVHAILMLLMTGLAIILLAWSLITLSRMINRQIDQMLTRCWQWLEKTRHLSPLTTLLRHHDPQKTHGQLVLAFYVLCTLGLFIGLALYITFNGSAGLIVNQSFFYLFRSLRTPEGDAILTAVSLLGSGLFLLPLTLTLSGWFFRQGRAHSARHLLVLGFGSAAVIVVIKHLVHSVRPSGILHVSPEFSFPSGHATLSAVFYFTIALLFGHSLHSRWRRLLYVMAGLAVLLVGLSRLYVGAHWFTDILGGWLLGGILLMLVLLSWRRLREKQGTPHGTLAVIVLTLLVSGFFTFKRDFVEQKTNTTQVDWPVHTVTLSVWWNQQDASLPLYRINRFGLARQILNLQWLGDLPDIRATLLKHGWQASPQTTWIDILHRLSNIQSTEHLPLVAPVYLSKEPVLVLVKRSRDKSTLVVLRLWQSDLHIADTRLPLWVGTIEEVPPTYSWLPFHRRQIALPLADLLFEERESGWEIHTALKQLNRHYRPSKRTILLVKPEVH